MPFHKNYENLLLNKTQKLYKLQHFNSYSPIKTKIAMIVGTIHRLNNNSENEFILYQSIMKLYIELQSLNYPIKLLLKALMQIYHKTNQLKYYTFIKNIQQFNLTNNNKN